MSVNAVPTGPDEGRISMSATGLGSVGGGPVVVVAFEPPPPPPHAARAANAKTAAAVAGPSRDRIRMWGLSWRAARGRRGPPRGGAASTWHAPRFDAPARA